MEKQKLEWHVTNSFGENSCALSVELKDYPYSAFIKWDGCCEIYFYKNNCKNDYDQIHICDISKFIEILQSLEEFRINNIVGAE